MPSASNEDLPSRALQELADELRAVNGRLVLASLHEQEAADAADRERERLHALLEALSEGVVIVDSSGRLTMLNNAGRRIAGLEQRETETTLADLVAVDFRHLDASLVALAEHPVSRALRGEAFTDVEMLLACAGRPTRRVVFSGTSISESASGSFALLVFRDVTERRTFEATVAHSERLAALGTLSAGMAHEINNPLTYVLANIDLVLAGLPRVRDVLCGVQTPEAGAATEAIDEFLEGLRDAKLGGLRVHHIVADIQLFGGAGVVKVSTLVLRDVVDRAIRMTSNIVRHHATLRVDHRGAPDVQANEGRLAQAFVNLLINAAEATGEGSAESKEIVVATYTDDAGHAVAEFRDAGPGVPAGLEMRIFDPFFTTKAVGRGMGMGLAITHSIVCAFGGELATENVAGGGAVFRVTLPAASLPSLPPLALEVAPAPSRRGRVLIIDDEPSIGRVVERLLRRDHDVAVFTDARAALACLGKGRSFDVVLCDLMMPGLTGMDFLDRVLDQHPALAPNVVFVTGGAFTPRAEEFFRTTRNDVVMKPLEPGALVRLVADYVSRRPSGG